MNSVNLNKQKNVIVYSAVLILLGTAFLLSICVGKYPIAVKDIFDIIFGNSVDEMTRNVFFRLRIPRTLMALIAGVGLSCAGSVYQSIFKNPLASPDILGVSSGANIGAAFAIVFLGGGMTTVALGAFVGGLAAIFSVLALVGMSREKEVVTYVLAGIAISALANALIMTMKFFADPERQLAAVEFWAMGSFAGITLDKLKVVVPIFLIGFTGLVLLRWQIMLLSLSDDEVKMLGVRVKYVRYGVLLCSTLMATSIVSVTGLITFIGLIAPHISRLILKKNDFNAFMLSGLVGAVILLFADCLARSLSSSELPISILTSLIGVPFLVYFMCNGKKFS